MFLPCFFFSQQKKPHKTEFFNPTQLPISIYLSIATALRHQSSVSPLRLRISSLSDSILASRSDTVSYTHLDVYKRQCGDTSFPAPSQIREGAEGFLTHMGLSQQPGQQRNKGHANEGNATSGDKLLDSLALARRVVRPVSLQKIDAAPYAKRSAEAHNDCLLYTSRCV